MTDADNLTNDGMPNALSKHIHFGLDLLTAGKAVITQDDVTRAVT